MNLDDADYWTGQPGPSLGAPGSGQVLHRVPIPATGVAGEQAASALQAALPDVPPALLDALYGPDAPRHAYLLVDGTLRAEVAGLFDLDVIDAPARSLFSGAAEEEAGEAGPWLVDLTIPDPETPGDIGLLRDLFERHWPAGYSLLVSTNAPFDALRRHLRRFIKRTVEDDGRLLTFRFWDPRVLTPFLDAIEEDGSRARRMTFTDEGVPLAYLLPPPEDAPDAARFAGLHVAPEARLADESLRPLRLRYADFDVLARRRAAERRARMAERLRRDFAAELADRPEEEVQSAVDEAVRRFGSFGFRAHAHLHFFAAWSLFYGPTFETSDATGELARILRSDEPEAERFRAFRQRFETFTFRKAV